MRLALATAALATAGLLLAGLVPTMSAAPAEGQGPITGGDVHIDDLNLGEYWYGAEIDKNELKGKVVLVELWGS